MSISRIGVAAALVSAAVLTGCTATRSTAAYPTTAAESFITSVADVPAAPVTRTPPSQLPMQQLVEQMVSEASDYWKERGVDMPKLDVVAGTKCGNVSATYCRDSIVYVASVMEQSRAQHGAVAVLEVIAHEVGHAVQHAVGIGGSPLNVSETRADCMSGAFTAMQQALPKSRAIEIFDASSMYDSDGNPTRAFRTGFEAQRNSEDTLAVCSTYQYN